MAAGAYSVAGTTGAGSAASNVMSAAAYLGGLGVSAEEACGTSLDQAPSTTQAQQQHVALGAPGSFQIGGSASSSSAGVLGAQQAAPPPAVHPLMTPNPSGAGAGAPAATNAENILVAVRCRPPPPTEACIVKVLDESLVILQDPGDQLQSDYLRLNKSRERRYKFDLAFSGQVSTEEVYRKTAQNLIPSILNGYNATVFAYGATGAGKTHTMIGPPPSTSGAGASSQPVEPGIMFLILRDLFHLVKTKSSGSGSGAAAENGSNKLEHVVKCSFLEVYNENIRDLLTSKDSADNHLELREDPVKGCYVAGLQELPAQSVDEIMALLHLGNRNRTTEGTAANETSSRSHAVLQLNVEEELGTGQTSIGKLSLIDLAGSERASKALSKGDRMIEASNINRSLLALGNCINALVENEKQRRAFIPYRDSKLTRLLKDSLGGNCRTCMIACISPTANHFEETSNTLKYANRTKNIKTSNYRRNLVTTTEETDAQVAEYVVIISDLQKEISELKQNSELKQIRAEAERDRILCEKESERWKTEMMTTLEERVKLQRELMETETLQSQLLQDIETEKTKNVLGGATPTTKKLLEEHEGRRSELLQLLDGNRKKSQNLQAQLEGISDKDLRAFLELLYRAQVLEVERMELDHVYAMKRQILDQKDQDLQNLRRQLDLRNEYLGQQQSYLSAEDRQLLPGHVSLLESTITSPSQWRRKLSKPENESEELGAVPRFSSISSSAVADDHQHEGPHSPADGTNKQGIDWSAIEVPKADKIKGVSEELAGLNIFDPTPRDASLLPGATGSGAAVGGVALVGAGGIGIGAGGASCSSAASSIASLVQHNAVGGTSVSSTGALIGGGAAGGMSSSNHLDGPRAGGSASSGSASTTSTYGYNPASGGGPGRSGSGSGMHLVTGPTSMAGGSSSSSSSANYHGAASSSSTMQSSAYAAAPHHTHTPSRDHYKPTSVAAVIASYRGAGYKSSATSASSGGSNQHHVAFSASTMAGAPSGSPKAHSSTTRGASSGGRHPGSPKRPDTVHHYLAGRINSGDPQNRLHSGGGPAKLRPKTDYQPQLRYAQRHQQMRYVQLQRMKETAFHDTRLNPPLQRGGVSFKTSVAAGAGSIGPGQSASSVGHGAHSIDQHPGNTSSATGASGVFGTITGAGPGIAPNVVGGGGPGPSGGGTGGGAAGPSKQGAHPASMMPGAAYLPKRGGAAMHLHREAAALKARTSSTRLAGKLIVNSNRQDGAAPFRF
mmetsp:Transcript_8672/g.20959  ORF Transcript_8672/g.20959 Transcript_8672/m.20959 type:complete len:1244 (+) Transcript_8672:100-3831(+)